MGCPSQRARRRCLPLHCTRYACGGPLPALASGPFYEARAYPTRTQAPGRTRALCTAAPSPPHIEDRVARSMAMRPGSGQPPLLVPGTRGLGGCATSRPERQAPGTFLAIANQRGRQTSPRGGSGHCVVGGQCAPNHPLVSERCGVFGGEGLGADAEPDVMCVRPFNTAVNCCLLHRGHGPAAPRARY